MNDPNFTQFRLWKRGHQYEDFEVGQRFSHHWGRTITSGDTSLFASIALRYCPLYLNAAYAKEAGYNGLLVDPLLVLATAIGMSVEDLSEAGGPFLGVNDVEFLQPVYPEDTIVCSSEVVDMRVSTSRAGFGIVTWRTTAFNQHGNEVLVFERTNLVAKREADG